MGADIEEWEHGRRSTYTNKGCRCGRCKAANAQYQSDLVASHQERTVRTLEELRQGGMEVEELPSLSHGKANTYTYYGCRCEQCKEAIRRKWRESNNRRKQRRQQEQQELLEPVTVYIRKESVTNG